MGKPFSRELDQIANTYQWAAKTPLPITDNDLSQMFLHPTLFVGSGGSLSACYFGAKLHEKFGRLAKAITPLELLQSTDIVAGSNIVLLSASGRNLDILKASEAAIIHGAKNILCIIMATKSKLAKKISQYEYSNVLELEIPTGRDGFLATNTLVAFFTILSRIYKETITMPINSQTTSNSATFISKLHENFTLIVLHSGWSTPVAYDIESKFSEAGLGNVLVTDYRNFAHGRHNWFDKKKTQSAIIQLTTPTIKDLAEKTIKLLPKSIPILKLETKSEGATASIELLLKSFQFVEAVGKKVGIDPGRPGVPDYGSKIYNMTYPKSFVPLKLEIQEKLWLKDKLGVANLDLFNKSEKDIISTALKKFRTKINKEQFGGLVFDYDGTLCTSKERFSTPSSEIKKILTDFLSNGLFVGIVTGRGKSVREALQQILPAKLFDQVIIGYYNGSQIAPLSDNGSPNNNIEKKPNLVRCFKHLSQNALLTKYKEEEKLSIELKAHMIEIQIKKDVFFPLKEMIKDLLVLHKDINTIKILESSHSMDIIDAKTSKLEIIPHCIALSERLSVSGKFICIGDRGSWPGNDYQLLSSDYSLSVDQASKSLETCWNLASPGVKGVSATKEYMRSISYYKGYFKIKL